MKKQLVIGEHTCIQPIKVKKQYFENSCKKSKKWRKMEILWKRARSIIIYIWEINLMDLNNWYGNDIEEGDDDHDYGIW